MPEAFTLLPDEELMSLLQRGSDAAFTQLVRRYKDSLTNFVYRNLGELDRTNDVVQETFVRVYHYRASFARGTRFATWLYQITRNAMRTELRRGAWIRDNHVRPDLESEGELNGWESYNSDDPLPDDELEGSMTYQAVQQALLSINPSYREVVVLRDIQQMSYEEIAEITGLESGTVKSRINRGRAQLQKLLRPIYYADKGTSRS